MKKTNRIFLAASILCSLVFTSCFDPIFATIRKDVAPEKATVSGNIASIARFTAGGEEYLFLAANDGLRYKNIKNESHGAWGVYAILGFTYHAYDYDSSTHKGSQILNVASDATNLYVFCADYEDVTEGSTNPYSISIWTSALTATNGGLSGSWSKVSLPGDLFTFYTDSNGYISSAFSVFKTNSPMTAHRSVYVRKGSYSLKKADGSIFTPEYYELKAGKCEKIATPAAFDAKKGESKDINSVVYFGGNPIYLSAKTASTNETYDKEATYFYYANGSTLNYCNSTVLSDTKSSFDAGGVISAIMTTSDSIIIGRGDWDSSSATGGLVRAVLDSTGKPAGSLSSFSTNASYQINSNYYILTLLNANPGKSELDASLYAAISFPGTGASSNVAFESIGLWSYYKGRGNWNRE